MVDRSRRSGGARQQGGQVAEARAPRGVGARRRQRVQRQADKDVVAIKFADGTVGRPPTCTRTSTTTARARRRSALIGPRSWAHLRRRVEVATTRRPTSATTTRPSSRLPWCLVTQTRRGCDEFKVGRDPRAGRHAVISAGARTQEDDHGQTRDDRAGGTDAEVERRGRLGDGAANERPRLSAYYSGGNGASTRPCGSGAREPPSPPPPSRPSTSPSAQSLAEVADAVAAWLPEPGRRASRADAAKMAMELAAQRNALSEAIDTVCGLDHELKSTGGAVPSNALDALRGWEARAAEERERCVEACQDVEPYTADVHRCVRPSAPSPRRCARDTGRA